jgi:hypothetical protein
MVATGMIRCWPRLAPHRQPGPEALWTTLRTIRQIRVDALDPSEHSQIGLENGVVLCVAAEGRHPGAAGPSLEAVVERGSLFLLNDAKPSYVRLAEEASKMRPIPLLGETHPWPAGPSLVRDLVQVMRTGGRTACDTAHARRATEIGFALLASSARSGAKVALPVDDRSLRVESLPWDNECERVSLHIAHHGFTAPLGQAGTRHRARTSGRGIQLARQQRDLLRRGAGGTGLSGGFGHRVSSHRTDAMDGTRWFRGPWSVSAKSVIPCTGPRALPRVHFPGVLDAALGTGTSTLPLGLSIESLHQAAPVDSGAPMPVEDRSQPANQSPQWVK